MRMSPRYPTFAGAVALCAGLATPLAAPLAADPPPAAAAPAAAAPAPAPELSPAEKRAAASYSIGVTFGEQLYRAGLGKDVSVPDVARGMQDAVGGKASTPEDRERISQFVSGAREAMANGNRAAAKEFLAKNGKEKGVVTTASGLQYKILSPGDKKAASPQPTDIVTVHYRGKLLDGTEFDSSYTRGEPATFPVNGVIKGWQEALPLMKPGAKWQLFLPPQLAYDADSPPPIPPGSMLLFDVELLRVEAAPPPPPMPPGHPDMGAPPPDAPPQ